ncbi:hypothetical protein KJ765_06875, partial [Candidatus Micrarchaeota archaeon]|nr:hypothetical protein [Candidatus Micrarchaeota archaeon]
VYGNLAEKFVKARMNENLNKIFHEVQLNEQEKTVLTSSSFKLIDDLVIRIRERRNNVWAFVLKNTYRPSLLKARFDIILSNPPWLAMSSFPAARYKSQLEKLIDKYNLTPSAQSKHHMEIATVFSVHSVAHYLRKNGIFAFVLPRVILNGDQHSPFRLSSFRQISPMKVDLLWDLEKVSPLFGRPACVIFGSYEGTGSGLPIELPRIEVSGNPNEYNKLIWKKKRSLHLNNLDSKTWFDENSIYRSTSKKGYQDLFRQGADLMPRRAVMVNIIGNRKAKILSVETSSIERANRLNKSPWDKIEFEGTIECEYIFTTLKSDSLLPFIVGKCAYAALPIEAYENKWRILKYGDLISRNHRKAREWFNKIDQKLKRLGNKTLNTWLNRKNKLTDQVLNHSKYLVLYGAGGTNVAAAVVNTSKFDFPFVNDQTLYAWDSSDENEAWYVCGMLNSLVINDAIKNKQPKGQFGEQHIHKLPLSLIPKFNPHNTFHRSLAQEAKLISLKAVRLCAANPNYINVAKSLASRRRAFSKVLAKDMNNLNEMAKQILSV